MGAIKKRRVKLSEAELEQLRNFSQKGYKLPTKYPLREV
jgi:hypothetical protein